MSVLLLGGTSEARALAVDLLAAGTSFVSSLAGRVDDPRLPVGETRIGGFGGVDGLRDWLRSRGTTAVVDATHPFAAGITRHAAAACALEEVPLLRLERPGWSGLPAASSWHWVDGHPEAAVVAAGLGARPFVTVGRQEIRAFVGPLADLSALVRVVQAPDVVLPLRWTLLRSRGPYPVDSERTLFADHGVDVLVTKDSGGDHTRAKLTVAAERGVPVVVVRRTPGPGGVRTVTSVAEAAAWVSAHEQP